MHIKAIKKRIWRELNPRPETFFCWFYMLSRMIWILSATLPIGGPIADQSP